MENSFISNLENLENEDEKDEIFFLRFIDDLRKEQEKKIPRKIPSPKVQVKRVSIIKEKDQNQNIYGFFHDKLLQINKEYMKHIAHEKIQKKKPVVKDNDYLIIFNSLKSQNETKKNTLEKINIKLTNTTTDNNNKCSNFLINSTFLKQDNSKLLNHTKSNFEENHNEFVTETKKCKIDHFYY